MTQSENSAYFDLKNGLRVLVDKEDLAFCIQYPWHTSHYNHVRHWKLGPLHRILMGALPGQEVDHINGDPLDNRRSNLRICSHNENLKNRKFSANNTSGMKGVFRDKYGKRWRAQIGVNGCYIHLGTFDTREEAAKAYKAAATMYFREFERVENV